MVGFGRWGSLTWACHDGRGGQGLSSGDRKKAGVETSAERIFAVEVAISRRMREWTPRGTEVEQPTTSPVVCGSETTTSYRSQINTGLPSSCSLRCPLSAIRLSQSPAAQADDMTAVS